ncbi:winged helix-turn-helix domain-containing protein [Aurantimonas sp. A2-1-M11]|uniref:winged helix-turn-helix domain-containing protein n=1 Tax=Aurantimonas sp. A2-1-M11 TaxID=3113712 RepID=UPI002F944819
MPDLAAWLEELHGVTADPSSLSKLMRQEGFTYKKNPAGIGERTPGRQGGAA